MGPTTFLPGTHRQLAHSRFDDTAQKDLLLQTSRTMQGPLGVGDAVTYDSRVLHCGGANLALPDQERGSSEQDRYSSASEQDGYRSASEQDGYRSASERVLLYLSFSVPGGLQGANNVASIHSLLAGKHTLASLASLAAPHPL
jgi:ectoine hydroxylase-related dioxygenase (phytanoyl-CoA dioxygenase family)